MLLQQKSIPCTIAIKIVVGHLPTIILSFFRGTSAEVSINMLKVWCAYAAYSVVFVIVFVVILCGITAAVICIPSGFFLGLVGGAMLLFDTSFVLTQLAPEIMMFGGLFAACFSAFLGFVCVKLGIYVARLFDKVRRYCDRLRGW